MKGFSVSPGYFERGFTEIINLTIKIKKYVEYHNLFMNLFMLFFSSSHASSSVQCRIKFLLLTAIYKFLISNFITFSLVLI